MYGGLIAGIELVKDKVTREPFPMEQRVGRQLYKILFEQGLVSRALVDTLVFAPALVINKEQVDKIVNTFAKGLDILARQL